jgi:hypothetical protein
MEQTHNVAPCLDILHRLIGLYQLNVAAAVRVPTDPDKYKLTEFCEKEANEGLLSFFLPAEGNMVFLSAAKPGQVFEGQDPEHVFAYLADHFPKYWDLYVEHLRGNLARSKFVLDYSGNDPLEAAVGRADTSLYKRSKIRVAKLSTYYKEHETVGVFLARHHLSIREQFTLTDATKKTRSENDELEAIIALVLIWLAVYPCGVDGIPGAEQLRFSKQTANKVAEIFSVSLPPERPDGKSVSFLNELIYCHPELQSQEVQKEYSREDNLSIMFDKIFMPTLPDYDLLKFLDKDNIKRKKIDEDSGS